MREWLDVKPSISQCRHSSIAQMVINPNDSIPSPAMSYVNPKTCILKTLEAVTQSVLNIVLALRDDRELLGKSALLSSCINLREQCACQVVCSVHGQLHARRPLMSSGRFLRSKADDSVNFTA